MHCQKIWRSVIGESHRMKSAVEGETTQKPSSTLNHSNGMTMARMDMTTMPNVIGAHPCLKMDEPTKAQERQRNSVFERVTARRIKCSMATPPIRNGSPSSGKMATSPMKAPAEDEMSLPR